MNTVVTGSLGYVSTPLIKRLTENGHSVTVISSKAEKQADIEALGAKAAIGNMEDVDFLTHAFTGADAVYCMLAPYGNFTDPLNDATAIIKRADGIAHNYARAIEKAGVKRVVYLSSIGADMEKGSGLIIIHHQAENILKTLPADVSISFIRAGGFYQNFMRYMSEIKHTGTIAVSYGGEDVAVWSSNLDIADAITEELEVQEVSRKVRYVASEELTCNEAARILGAAINKPDLKWITLSDEEQSNALKAHGMNDSVAHNFVEMNACIHSGEFYEDYNRHKPALGNTRLEDFAKDFAAVYHQQ